MLRYERDIKLDGIIYLHRITNNRMAGTPLRNLRVFRKLCGDTAFSSVVLVTTMWDRVDECTGSRREMELLATDWSTMINYGATSCRFSNTADSAWNIVKILRGGKVLLLLQEEIVELKLSLNETQAGKTLYSDLQRLLAEQRDTVRCLAEQAREESNPEAARQFEAELQRIQKDFDNLKTFSEIKDLKVPFGKNHMSFFRKESQG